MDLAHSLSSRHVSPEGEVAVFTTVTRAHPSFAPENGRLRSYAWPYRRAVAPMRNLRLERVRRLRVRGETGTGTASSNTARLTRH